MSQQQQQQQVATPPRQRQRQHPAAAVPRPTAPPRQRSYVSKCHTTFQDLPEDTTAEDRELESLLIPEVEQDCPSAPRLDPVRPPTPRPPSAPLEYQQQQQQPQPQAPPQQRHTAAAAAAAAYHAQFAAPEVHPSRLPQSAKCQVQLVACMWCISMIHKNARSFLEGATVARKCPGCFLPAIIVVPLCIARDWCRHAIDQCTKCLQAAGTAVERTGGLTDVLLVVHQDLSVILNSIQATINFVLHQRLDPRGAPEDFVTNLDDPPIPYHEAVQIERLASSLHTAFVGECNRAIDGLAPFLICRTPYTQERAVPMPPSSRPPSPRRPSRKRAATPPPAS